MIVCARVSGPGSCRTHRHNGQYPFLFLRLGSFEIQMQHHPSFFSGGLCLRASVVIDIETQVEQRTCKYCRPEFCHGMQLVAPSSIFFFFFPLHSNGCTKRCVFFFVMFRNSITVRMRCVVTRHAYVNLPNRTSCSYLKNARARDVNKARSVMCSVPR